MRALLIAMGLWVRWIILGLLFPLGVIHFTCCLIRLLYRVSPALARRPLWTAVVTHLVVVLALILALAAGFHRLFERIGMNAG